MLQVRQIYAPRLVPRDVARLPMSSCSVLVPESRLHGCAGEGLRSPATTNDLQYSRITRIGFVDLLSASVRNPHLRREVVEWHVEFHS